MTEADWLTSTDPEGMLNFLRDSGMLSQRKAGLFSVAVCRRIWHLLTQRSHAAVEIAEQYADGLVGILELDAARQAAAQVQSTGVPYNATLHVAYDDAS